MIVIVMNAGMPSERSNQVISNTPDTKMRTPMRMRIGPGRDTVT